MGGFPALMINQPESPIRQYGEAQQIAQGQIQLEQLRQQQIDTQAMTKAMAQWDGKDPNQLPHLVSQNGGSGTASLKMLSQIQDARLKTAEIASKDAETNSKNFETHVKQSDEYRGKILSVVNAPAERQQPLWDAEITAEEQAGKIQPGQVSHTYPGNEEAMVLANHFALGSVLAKEHTEAVQAQARQSLAATAAAKLPAEQEHLAAQTALEKTQTAQAGQVTPKDVYVQNQENYRATLARQAQNANQIQRQGIESLQKQSDAYSEFASKANVMKANIQLSKDGNEMASAISPLAGTLFIVKAEGGISRINETETKGIAGAGDLVTRINGALSKQITGASWPDSLKNDMVKLVDIYTEAKYQSYKKQTDYTKKLHGLDAKTTPVLSKDGSIEGEAEGEHPFFGKFGGKVKKNE